MVAIAEQASVFTEIDGTTSAFSGMGDGIPSEIAVGNVRKATTTGMREVDGTTVAIGSMVGVEGAMVNVDSTRTIDGTARGWGGVTLEITIHSI